MSSPRTVHDWIKLVHTYLGLINFSHLIVFGLAGLVVTFSAPRTGPPPPTATEEVAYSPPADATVAAIAEDLYERLDLPLAGRIQDWALPAADADPIVLNFYTMNGPYRVRLERNSGVVHIETRRNSLGQFINNMHASLRVYDFTGDWRMWAWTAYVELALWSLIAMSLSGVYLWLAARPRPWAWTLLILGISIFIALYAWTR